jgi:hypothetical protein
MTTQENSHIVKLSNTEEKQMSRFSQLIKDLEQNDREAREVEAKIEAMQERVVEVNQEAQELNDIIGWLEIEE